MWNNTIRERCESYGLIRSHAISHTRESIVMIGDESEYLSPVGFEDECIPMIMREYHDTISSEWTMCDESREEEYAYSAYDTYTEQDRDPLLPCSESRSDRCHDGTCLHT